MSNDTNAKDVDEMMMDDDDGDDDDDAGDQNLSTDDDNAKNTSDSESESSDELENMLGNKYNDLMQQISEQKYNYDNYVALIDTAHQLNDLNKIRESSEIFASVYPLAPEIWLKRLMVEQSIATTESEYKKLHQLFKRALADYFSADIAIEYARLTFHSAKSNEIWEELISTYALHCLDGRKLFKLWREYLNKIEPESAEKYAKLLKSYELELAIPLYEMEESYIDLKVMAETQKDKFSVNWTDIDEKYNKAKDSLKRILPFEKKFAELDRNEYQERAKLYMEYIKESSKYLDQNIVQILYERMVTDCCLNSTCWLNYIKYIQSRDGYRPPHPGCVEQPLLFSQTDWDLVNRAIRNCSWSADIYVEKLRIAEQMELPHQEVQSIAEFAISAGFEMPEPLVTIWIEYLSYLRRNTNFSNEREVEILRATFDLAWTTLGKQFGERADCNCELLQIWGRLEYGPLNDFTKAKELWTTIMASGDNSFKSGLWIEFAYLEMKRGADGARKVFRKALSIDYMDNINVIISAWIRFENCYGTLEQLKACQEHCKERAAREPTSNNYGGHHKGKGSKRKAPDRTHEHQMKDNKMNHKSHRNVMDLNAMANSKNKIERKQLAGVEPMAKKAKIEHVEVAATQTNIDEIDTSKDDQTIFLSNLDYNVTADDVIEAFPELSIQHVNIIKTTMGKSRGFGYVTLDSKDQVEQSLTFDRRSIKGRPTFISSVLRDRSERIKFKYAHTIEATKLFVKGLPFDATKEELEAMFSEFGALKDVRLVCHKSGKPKGIAYLEYVDEESARKAVRKNAEFTMRNFVVNVAISAPPPRPSAGGSGSNFHPKSLPGLGEGRRSNKNIQGELKPRMSFIPRAVQKNILNATTTVEQQQDTPSPKTNDDFRNMLKLTK